MKLSRPITSDKVFTPNLASLRNVILISTDKSEEQGAETDEKPTEVVTEEN